MNWKQKFDKDWIREDGLLGIGKYDRDEVVEWFQKILDEECTKVVDQSNDSSAKKYRESMSKMNELQRKCINIQDAKQPE